MAKEEDIRKLQEQISKSSGSAEDVAKIVGQYREWNNLFQEGILPALEQFVQQQKDLSEGSLKDILDKAEKLEDSFMGIGTSIQGVEELAARVQQTARNLLNDSDKAGVFTKQWNSALYHTSTLADRISASISVGEIRSNRSLDADIKRATMLEQQYKTLAKAQDLNLSDPKGEEKRLKDEIEKKKKDLQKTKKLDDRRRLTAEILDLNNKINLVTNNQLATQIKIAAVLNKESELQARKVERGSLGAASAVAGVARKLGLNDLAEDVGASIGSVKQSRNVKYREAFENTLKDKKYKINEKTGKVVDNNEVEVPAEEVEKLKAEALKATDISGELKGLWKDIGSYIFSAATAKALALGFAIKLWKALKDVSAAAADLKRHVGSWEIGSAAVNEQLASSVDWLKTASELAQQTGLQVTGIFSSSEIAAAAEFKNLTGATAEQAGNLAIRAKLAGQNTKEFRDHITEGFKAGNKLNDSAVTLKAVQDGVLNASNATTLSYRDNAKALGQAVVAAKNLGMELEGVERISEQLIQFESSIGNQMEAQLLTGMQINLQKAREYALNNDLEGVATEIQRQGVTAAKFGHMNVIAQTSLAKALGMSREELAKSLVLRELNNNKSKEAVAQMMGMKTEQIEAISLQDQWRIVTEKLMQAFTPILEAVVQLIMPVSKIVGWIAKGVGWISQGIGWIFRFFGLIGKGEQDLNRQASIWQTIIGGIVAAGALLVGFNKTLKGTSLLVKGISLGWKGIVAVKNGIVGGAKGLAGLIAHPGQTLQNMKPASAHRKAVVTRAKKIADIRKAKNLSSTITDTADTVNKASQSNVRGLDKLGNGIRKFFNRIKVIPLAGVGKFIVIMAALGAGIGAFVALVGAGMWVLGWGLKNVATSLKDLKEVGVLKVFSELSKGLANLYTSMLKPGQFLILAGVIGLTAALGIATSLAAKGISSLVSQSPMVLVFAAALRTLSSAIKSADFGELKKLKGIEISGNVGNVEKQQGQIAAASTKVSSMQKEFEVETKETKNAFNAAGLNAKLDEIKNLLANLGTMDVYMDGHKVGETLSMVSSQ